MKKIILIVLTSLVLFAEVNIPSDKCALIVASKKTMKEVKSYVKNEIKQKQYITIYEANNGWYAIALGFLKDSEEKSVISNWKKISKIPNDSFCAKADKFSQEMDLTLESNTTTTKIEVPKMLVMKKGSFIMGCEGNKSNCHKNELPSHRVKIDYDFEISKEYISIKEYMKFVNDIKSGYLDFEALLEYGEWGSEPPSVKELKKEILPNEKSEGFIVGMTPANAQAYIYWLNDKTGKNYRLPIEAELEYVLKSKKLLNCFYFPPKPKDNKKCEEYVVGTELLADSYSDTYKDTPRDGSKYIGAGNRYVIRGFVGNDVYYGRGYLERHRGFHRVGFRIARTLNEKEK